MTNPLDQLAGMLDTLNCGAMLMDRAATIIYVNKRLAAMFSLPKENLIGCNLREFYPDDNDRRPIDEALEKFHEPREMEFYIPQPDGSRKPVLVSGRLLDRPILDREVRVITIFDTTKQREIEERSRAHFREVAKLSDTVIEQAIKLKEYSGSLETKVAERTKELHDANMDAIYMLAVAAEAKDVDTGQHVLRVQQYSEAIARELGLPESQAEQIGYSSILHDVGKIHIPDHILKKPAPLTEAERLIMETHTTTGERILSEKRFFDVARQIARSHHENWDGSGYPDGRKHEEIPIPARIVHIADVFDALTHKRVYKDDWTMHETIRFLHEQDGQYFDPTALAAFLKLVNDGFAEKVYQAVARK